MRAASTRRQARTIEGLLVTSSTPEGVRVCLGRWRGDWRIGPAREWLQVLSPATGEVVGFAGLSGLDAVVEAIRSARNALPALASVCVEERISLCRRIEAAILARRSDLARLLSLEQGKNIREALAEVSAAAEAFGGAADRVGVLREDASVVQARDRLSLGRRRCLGVVALVSGHAYPVGPPTLDCIAPAVATGNAVVWHPAPSTSLAAAALVECMMAAELPDGAVNLVLGSRAEIAPVLVRHPGIDGVAVILPRDEGTALAAAARGKPCWQAERETSVVIVASDADIEGAAQAVARRSCGNAGQLAGASARVLVDGEAQHGFVEALCQQISEARFSGSAHPSISIGPVNNISALCRVERQLADARRRGGRIIGGAVAAESPTRLHIEPAVVCGIGASSMLNIETSQGPVAPVLKFRTADEMRELARAGPIGRSIAVFTRSPNTALETADELAAEVVTMNEIRNCLDGCGADGLASGESDGTCRILRKMSPLTTLSMRIPRRGESARGDVEDRARTVLHVAPLTARQQRAGQVGSRRGS